MTFTTVLLPVLLLCSLKGDLFSENPSGLKGRVASTTGGPLRNAYILVHKVLGDSAKDLRARTEQDGKYSIELPIGIYDVFISAPGYEPVCRKVEIESDGMMIFDVALKFTTVGRQMVE